MKRCFFDDERSYRDYHVLKALGEARTPLGSWVLQEKLMTFGIELSIASIGRTLRRLDFSELTVRVRNSGRAISGKGSDHLRKVETGLRRAVMEEDLIRAANPKDRKEFLDLLRARKVLEVETARLAASNATREDLANLEAEIDRHAAHISGHSTDSLEVGCGFHERVAEASHNRFLGSALRLLVREEVEIERKFSYPTAPSQGLHYVEAHLELLRAIKSGDGERALRVMDRHMSDLVQEIEAYFDGATVAVREREDA